MSVRFRIRTSQGQEISFASHEMFAEFVRSGDLSPDDVVYDAETREWSSAMTHPVVLEINMEDEDESSAEAGPTAQSTEDALDAEDAAPEESTASAPVSDIGLELAPAPDQMTPDQEAAAFVKKMEAERASDIQFEEEPALQGFTMEQGSSGLVENVEEEAPPPPPPPPPRAEPRDEPRREAPTRKSAKKAKKAKAPKQKRKGAGKGRKYAPLVIVGIVVAAGGVYFGPELLAPSTGEAGIEIQGDSLVAPPSPAPVVPEEALRESAQERYLTTTRALLRDLPPIPESWLQGAYLAAPSDFPDVRSAWEAVLTTVQQVRAGDNERYRAGYTRALDDAGVDGSNRALRVAGAVSAFQGEVAARAAHYDRVEALATAALRGHDALVDAEGTIAYEPSSSAPPSGGPVVEAVGRNPGAQSLLDQVLEMIHAELDEPNGPGQAATLGEWIFDGLLDAVSN